MKYRMESVDFEKMVEFCLEQGACVLKDGLVVWIRNPELLKKLKEKNLII